MNSFYPNFLPFAASLGISAVFTLSIIDLARKKNLFEANSKIKLHTEQVCSLGGVSIFSAFWIASCLYGSGITQPAGAYLFAGSFLLFLTGIKDDLVGLPPLQRLAIQIGVASLLFYGGVQLTHLPGMATPLPPVASYFLTIFLIGAVVNAFNFIDGMNGLAGGLALISSIAFALLFFLAGANEFAVIALILAGAILGFLLFNFGKAKIFMGDNGSTFIGIMLSFLTIVFLRPEIQAEMPTQVSPAILVAVLLVPMMDMLKVVCGRLIRKKSPFRGDLTHVHHLCQKKGLSSLQVCSMLFAWNALVIVLSFFWLPQNTYIAAFAILLVGSVPYLVLNLSTDKVHTARRSPALKPTKIRELL